MKTLLIILFFLLINIQSVTAQIITNSGIQRLERKLFDETYENETFDERLQRLETKLFGTIQDGSLDQRYLTLRSAAKSYKAYNPYYYNPYYANNMYYKNYNNQYRPPIFTGATGSSWKATALNNFRNQFIGTPTGITPAMDPAYMDWFEAERAMMGDGERRYSRTNRGYSNNNTERGAKTGVTIID